MMNSTEWKGKKYEASCIRNAQGKLEKRDAKMKSLFPK
jgi:hypothetical protein